MKRALNLGCQIHRFESQPDVEWVNQDIVSDDPNIKADVYCDANKLPFEDETFDYIYAGHLVEHFYPDTINEYITEWRRVLKQGGTLFVVTPDCGLCFRMYADGAFGVGALMQQVYGRIYSTDRPEERHHIIFDAPYLNEVLTIAGFPIVTPFSLEHPPEPLKPFMGQHISTSNLQLSVKAIK